MKKFKKILITLLVITMLPLTAYAETFKTDAFEFELIGNNISCLPDHMIPDTLLKNGRILYIEYEVGADDEIKFKDNYKIYIPKTNKCEDPTAQDFLDAEGTIREKYIPKANSNGDVIIYKETEQKYSDLLILTKDTEIKENKIYYEKTVGEDGEGYGFGVADNDITAADLPTLYESIVLTPPTVAKIEEGKKYYYFHLPEETKMEVAEVAEPKESDIHKYLVEIDKDDTETREEVKKYTNNPFGKIATSLGHNNFGAIKLGSLNEYNFIVEETYTPEGEDDSVIAFKYDIYSKNGNLIFDDLTDPGNFAPLENKAYIVLTRNKQLNLFDGNLKLAKTFEDKTITLVDYEKGEETDTAYLISLSNKMYQLKITQTGEIVEQPPAGQNNPKNPNTSDKIIISIIIAILSVVGLKKVSRKVRQSF